MENISWIRQSKEPAFADVLWSQPQNKRGAGKLLIIGGHKQSFNAVSAGYSTSLKAGVGSVRVILPDSLQRMLRGVLPEAEYAPTNSIGSFSRQALDTLLLASEWSDAVLLAGDFGHNSETAVLLESFIDKYRGRLTLAGDSLEYFQAKPDKIFDRSGTVIVCSLASLQKLAQPKTALRQTDDLVQILKRLDGFSREIKTGLVINNSAQIIVACDGKQSTTPISTAVDDEALAAYVSVWWLQQPEKIFEALTTAAWCYAQ